MKALKWTGIILGCLIVLVVAALFLIPMFVDVEQYKPTIEKMVTDATGRPFRLAGKLHLSLFPWAGIALSDAYLENPPGFDEKDFVSVKSFEVRVKLLPLLSKNVEVKKFVLDSPRIVVIKDKNGKWNWEGLGKGPAAPGKSPETPEKEPTQGMPIGSLAVGQFLVSNGSVLFEDQGTGVKKEIRDFRLELKDVSFDKPIHVALSAMLDTHPVSLTGTVGPVGEDPGKATIPLDMRAEALKKLDVKIRGQIAHAASTPSFNLNLTVAPFSPRKTLEAFGKPFPVVTSDPNALDSLALKAILKGTPSAVSITDGTLSLDSTEIAFSVKAKAFDKPDLSFDLNVNAIDLDRYLPPAGKDEKAKGKKEEPKAKGKPSAVSKPKKADYGPLRRMVLDGRIRIGRLYVKKAKVEELEMKITGRNGVFQLNPLTLNMYQGSLKGNGTFDVKTDTPQTAASLHAKGIQVNPLLKDILQKDFLEGILLAQLAISMQGQDPGMIKRTLNGKGELVFTDGAIKGVNLTDMAQNVKSAFGAGGTSTDTARTDFSELRVPFVAKDGVIQTPGTSMVTPLMRLVVTGKTNLVQETLDFRVEPKGVATLKGKGDTQDRSGIMVPIVVSGTFASPQFRPDLEGIAKQQLDRKLEEVLKDKTKDGGASSKGLVNDLLKKLPFGK